MLSLREAMSEVERAANRLEAEGVAVDAALGRVLAEAALAAHDVQPFDNSAMDGFAVKTGAAGELAIVGESRAGAPAERTLADGEAIAISTGAQVPDGAEAVVPIEKVRVEGSRVMLEEEAMDGANIRRAGEDFRRGDVVVPAGTDLGPAEIAACATAGIGTLKCTRRPTVGIVVTGDELVAPDEELGPGQIHESNGLALLSLAERAGTQPAEAMRVGDDAERTREAIAWALEETDVAIVCGGISAGEHDHVRDALLAQGVEERFWRIDLKPGKPTWFGVRGGQLAFGLPGNPVSALVTFELLVRPAIDLMLGRPPRQEIDARWAGPVRRKGGRTEAMRVSLRLGSAGFEAAPTGAQGSHQMSSLLGADGLALVPPDAESIEAGEPVRVLPLIRLA